MGRIIIGLTGAFGCGASFIADHFFVENRGFKKVSLSSALKEKYKESYGELSDKRSDLQEFGNSIRKQQADILSEIVDKEISKKFKNDNVVIDSIRNPAEIEYFRKKYPNFILIGVFADYDIRWGRVKETYNNSQDDFNKDEIKDKGNYEPKTGQKISDCFFESDIIISNNAFINITDKNEAYDQMETNIKTYLEKIDNPIRSQPTVVEALMAEAYASGRRSFCLKRKVGAVIADKYNRTISAGHNSVPIGLQECRKLHGNCYKDEKRKAIAKSIARDCGIECSDETVEKVKRNIKVLEACRALHAEESAILNLVGRGMNLEGSTMYVTTYPCNLCANKIVQSKIKKVIYFEPYPVEEAKLILKTGEVETEAFEGVTFRAFFRFYKYEP